MISLSDLFFMNIARNIANQSPNRGRKTSAVFTRKGNILVAACNTFPHGVARIKERFERPTCYLYIEHAERNAIAHAAREGTSLYGSTAYLPWFPCVECARMLVGVGTERMVCVEPDWEDTMYHFKDSRQILIEGGVNIEYVKEN